MNNTSERETRTNTITDVSQYLHLTQLRSCNDTYRFKPCIGQNPYGENNCFVWVNIDFTTICNIARSIDGSFNPADIEDILVKYTSDTAENYSVFSDKNTRYVSSAQPVANSDGTYDYVASWNDVVATANLPFYSGNFDVALRINAVSGFVMFNNVAKVIIIRRNENPIEINFSPLVGYTPVDGDCYKCGVDESNGVQYFAVGELDTNKLCEDLQTTISDISSCIVKLIKKHSVSSGLDIWTDNGLTHQCTIGERNGEYFIDFVNRELIGHEVSLTSFTNYVEFYPEYYLIVTKNNGAVYKKLYGHNARVNYGYSNSELQFYDISFPYKGNIDEKYPVLITIHGGQWENAHDTVDDNTIFKFYEYSDMKEFANDNGWVYVNMEYRGTNSGTENEPITYVDMLADIHSVIEDICAKYGNNAMANRYIDESKFALMGHSAGGHLALLYAYAGYKCGDNWIRDNRIKVVISEAGPTCFGRDNDGDPYISAMKGNAEYEDISPIYFANMSSPKTILAYGFISDSSSQYYATDGLVPFNNVEKLVGMLLNGTPDNYSFIGDAIELTQISAYKFENIGHSEMLFNPEYLGPSWKTEPQNNYEKFFKKICDYLDDN